MRTRLTDLLGVEHPVMLAGMGGVSYSALAAAVSAAGGFGCLGASTMNNEMMVGEMAAEYPDVVREVAEQGHTLGTHTWSHLNLKRLHADAMKEQIEAAITAVEKSAGAKIAPFFRYPYLSDSPATVAYLQSRNIAQFAIDVDSFDWRTRNAKNVVRRVMTNLAQQGRGIILLHDIHSSTAAAVPELLAELKAKGYRIVHLQPSLAVETLPGFGPPVKTAHTRAVHRLRLRARSGTSPTWMIW